MKKSTALRLILFCMVSLICVTASLAQLNTNFIKQIGCNGVVTFTAVQSGYTTYMWSFGDNTTATGPSVVHDYAAQGNYIVQLTIVNAPDSSVGFSNVYVGQFINQQLSGPTDVCSGTTATYLLANASANLQYNWLVAGATLLSNAAADSAQLSFTTQGSGAASVIIGNGAGCDSILKQNFTVHVTPQLTLPGHSVDTQQISFGICQNTPVWYHVLTNTPGNITWSSPGGTTLSAQGVDSMLFIFPTAGVTTIHVADVTPWGCTDSVVATVTISANPLVTVSATSACLGSDNNFTATSNPPGSLLTYQWVFDDGGQATGPDVTHTFATTGTHTGAVIGVNQNGCVDTASTTTTVDVHPGPPIVCVGPVCAGAQEVYSTTTVVGASYHWAITGGTVTAGGTLNDNTVAVTWGNGAMGTVSLFITGPGTNCQVATIENVPLVGGALAIQGTTTPCLYNTATYTTDIIPGGVYTWAVNGGGAIASGQGTNQIQVQFNSTAPATVSVNINHQILSCSSNANLAVTPLNPFQVYGNANACAGIVATFNTYATGAFNWTVTGGTIISGNGTNSIQVLWNNAGNYDVKATIASGYCNTDADLNVSVITRKQEVVHGSATACAGSTENYSISPNEYTYAWSVIHGTATIVGSGNSNSVVVTVGTAGTDSLMVIYKNANYCPDTAFYQIVVAPAGVPNITGDTLACYGSTVNYSFTPVAGVAYSWETESGAIISGQGTANVSVMWIGNQSGILRLRNTVCNTFKQLNIVIRPTPLVHIETANLNCTGSSADLKVVEDYPGYNWSSGANTQSITITSSAVYTVTVTDSKGCTATGTENANPIPNNSFTYATIVVSGPGIPYPYPYLSLFADAFPVPTSYLWSTGNTEATEYVSVSGTYSVTMTNEYGCTAVQSVNTTAAIGAIICGGGGGNPPVMHPCPGLSPVFTTNSPACNPVQFTPGVVATYYLWDFGDNVYSTSANPSHRFTNAGNQTILLNYSNDGTNWYQCSQTLTINSVMNINFTVSNACNGASTLTNTSTSALPVSSVLWDFGDATTSAVTPVVVHNYATTSPTYPVILTLNDGVCTDHLQKAVTIERIVAGFTYADVCINNPALFNDATAHSALISSYSWSFGNGETEDYNDPVTYFRTTANYNVSLTVTDANGCSSVNTQSVPVNQFGSLTVTASGPLTFCRGGSVDLSLPAGYSIYWNTGDTGTTIHVTQSGTYFAFAKDLVSGCSGFSDTVTVIVNIPPDAFIGNPAGATSFCQGAQFNLNGLPYSGVTYQWYFDNATSSTSGNMNFWYATTTNSGDYQLVITDGNGCKDTSAITHITVNPVPAYPSITQSPAGTVCSGQPITLSVNGSDLYQWSTGAGGHSTTVYQGGSYSVVATNSFGCSTNAYTWVNLSPSPDFTYFPTGCYQICQNSNITVSGPVGMQTYLWSNGANTQSITLSTGGTYTLSATATDGCAAQSGSFSVDVFGSANLNLGNDTTICAGQPLVLDAGVYPTILWQDGTTSPFYTVVDSGLYHVTVTTSQGCIFSDSIHVNIDTLRLNIGDDTTLCTAVNLLLTPNSTSPFTSIVWQDGSTAAVYTVTQTGSYYANITDANGCKAGDTIQVNVFASSVSLGNDTTICSGSVLILAVNGTFTSIAWQDGSTSPNYTVSQTGLYYVNVTNANGCSVADSIVVTVHTPIVELGNDTSLCPSSILILTATGNFVNAVWQDGTVNSIYTINRPGLYDVTATDSFGCVASDSINVAYYPPVQFACSANQRLCDSTVNISAGGQFSSYLWSNGATTETTAVAAIGVFYVTVTDNNGCTASDSTAVLTCDTISIRGNYFVPNVFTPNGDGSNDVFGLYRRIDTEPAQFFSMSIFNRTGERVFEANSEAATWDGTFRSKPAPEGVYVYIIKYVSMSDDVTVKGAITLLR